MIELSFNEVETLAAKAARGAGFDWGLAEEIGRGAVKLAREGRDWSGELLALLEARPAGAVCPVRAAAWLNDAPPGEAMVLRDVARPVWLKAIVREVLVETDLSAERADVLIRPVVPASAGTQGPDDGRPAISQARLDALGVFAAHTYVPESETSRTRGAGGGRVDDE